MLALNGGDLLPLLLLGDWLGNGVQVVDCRLNALVDAAFDGHRIGAGGNVAQALLIQGKGQDSGRGGPIAGHVAGLLSHRVDQLGAHVLERIGQLDFLADGDAVLGHGWTAKTLVEDDIATSRAKRDTDGVGQFLGPGQQFLAASSV